MNVEEIRRQIDSKKALIKKLEHEIQELENHLDEEKENENLKNLSLDEKVSIFMDYFKGRLDVYPYLSINKDNKYYQPACKNEWRQGVCNKTMGKKCKNCKYRENIPLTKDIIYKHLCNNKTIGIYPLLADDRDILKDAGKISHEIAMDKALTEFEKYRIKQDKIYKSDFDLLLEESGSD